MLLLVGSTASGKKQVAAALRDEFHAELLSLDSMKVYRGLNRGTDKSEQTRFGLTDLVDPTEHFSVGEYVRLARRACEAAWSRQRLPFFVGGTGLYLRSLLHGFVELPAVAPGTRAAVEARFEAEGGLQMHAELQRVDPAAAARIHPNDRKRICRALEVHQETGRCLSDWQSQHTVPPIPARAIVAGIRWSRETLRRRIQTRIERMFAGGLVAEVQALLQSGALGPLAFEAIGYREVVHHLRGEYDEEECRVRILRSTWRLMRHQASWFRQFPGIQWVEPADDEDLAAVTRRCAVVYREALAASS